MREILFILLCGLISRLIYDWHFSHSIFFGVYQLDSLVLHSWALDILGGGSPDTAFFRAPLYPYLIAWLYKLFGVTPWAVMLFQNLLGLGTAVITYLLARRLFGTKATLISSIVVALFPTLLILEAELLNTTLEVFLYTLTVYLMTVAVDRPNTRSIIAAGIALGLAAICRPLILPFAFCFPILLFLKDRTITGKLVRSTLLFTVAVLIPILPVTITNITKGGEFVLISTQEVRISTLAIT